MKCIGHQIFLCHKKLTKVWKLKHWDIPDWHAKLRGSEAARADFYLNQIRINGTLYLENKKDFLEGTIPHEISHLASFAKYGAKVISDPHGNEWLEAMDILGVKANVFHNYKINKAPPKPRKRYEYFCGCRNHLIAEKWHRANEQDIRRVKCPFCEKIAFFTGKVLTGRKVEII